MNFKEGDILEIINKGGRQYSFYLNGDKKNEIVNENIDKNIIEKSLFNKNNLIFVNGNFIENINNKQITNYNMNDNEITKELGKIINNIPSDIVISERKWKILGLNILKCENTMIVGPTGTGKTTIVHSLAKALNRPFYKFPLGSSQDPRTMLIGTTEFVEGVGTKFIPSEFVEAIQVPNAVILLDEFTRINYEAENILFTVLDHQRYIKLDELGKTINVADGVTFVATANIGTAYTATRIVDRASLDRFTRIELPFLTVIEEHNYLTSKFPEASEEDIRSLVKITASVRDDYKQGGEIYGNELISTRHCINIISKTIHGVSLRDVLEETILPMFENEGDVDTPYLKFKTLIDREINAPKAGNSGGNKNPNSNNVFAPRNTTAKI